MVHWLDCSAGAKQSDFLPGGILAQKVGFLNQPVVTAIIVVLTIRIALVLLITVILVIVIGMVPARRP